MFEVEPRGLVVKLEPPLIFLVEWIHMCFYEAQICRSVNRYHFSKQSYMTVGEKKKMLLCQHSKIQLDQRRCGADKTRPSQFIPIEPTSSS